MDLDIIIKAMIVTAKKAGDFIKKERQNFNPDDVQVKGLNDMVSYVDKTAEQIIVADLGIILPEAGYVVEENTLSGKKTYNWIVDPLDGTTNFIHGLPCYAVSIGLEHEGVILAGVVYEVTRDECFYATRGGGAFLNNQPIKTSACRTISQSLVATGFPIYNFSKLDNYINAIRFFMQHTHGVRRIGAASVDLCYLACGRVDAFFEYNLSPWDVAAGALVVMEAGGHVNDFSGGNNWLFGKEISCTNGPLKESFNRHVSDFFGKG